MNNMIPAGCARSSLSVVQLGVCQNIPATIASCRENSRPVELEGLCDGRLHSR